MGNFGYIFVTKVTFFSVNFVQSLGIGKITLQYVLNSVEWPVVDIRVRHIFYMNSLMALRRLHCRMM